MSGPINKSEGGETQILGDTVTQRESIEWGGVDSGTDRGGGDEGTLFVTICRNYLKHDQIKICQSEFIQCQMYFGKKKLLFSFVLLLEVHRVD